MTRWALKLEYNGGGFVGWQKQDSGLSLQEVLEGAAARLNKNEPVESTIAGRTDSGVHAENQVAMLDLPDGYTARQVRDALNYHMKPHPMVVKQAAVAPEGWNPRFSAIHRAYRYRILNRRARPALLAGLAWHVAAPLDADAMHAAAQTLLGRHDFSSFRAAACQAKSPIRTLDRLGATCATVASRSTIDWCSAMMCPKALRSCSRSRRRAVSASSRAFSIARSTTATMVTGSSGLVR